MSNTSSKNPGADQSPSEPESANAPGTKPEFISKTAQKRDAERLQKLGLRIAALPAEQLEELAQSGALSDKLLHAIREYNRFPSREAKRRQLQYVGKLMRGVDSEPIIQRMDFFEGQTASAKFTFHQTETWRDRLLTEPEALAEYITEHPQVDRQALRHTLKKARSAKNPDQARKVARELFRLLREQEDLQAGPTSVMISDEPPGADDPQA